METLPARPPKSVEHYFAKYMELPSWRARVVVINRRQNNKNRVLACIRVLREWKAV